MKSFKTCIKKSSLLDFLTINVDVYKALMVISEVKLILHMYNVLYSFFRLFRDVLKPYCTIHFVIHGIQFCT